jgi:hypothetical protein
MILLAGVGVLNLDSRGLNIDYLVVEARGHDLVRSQKETAFFAQLEVRLFREVSSSTPSPSGPFPFGLAT